MNILLIGEYSGFAKNLKEGLVNTGNTVVHFHEGDSWKKISTKEDSYVYSFRNNIKLLNKKIRGSWRLLAPYFFFKI